MQPSPRRVAFYECHQYFLRTACPALHDPTAPPDAQAETTGRGVWITKNVPILRIDYVSTKGKLLGMRQALYSGGVLDFNEMNRHCRSRFAVRFTDSSDRVLKFTTDGRKTPFYTRNRRDP